MSILLIETTAMGLFRVLNLLRIASTGWHRTWGGEPPPKPGGTVPLNPVDSDAGRKTAGAGKASGCNTRRTSSLARAGSYPVP